MMLLPHRTDGFVPPGYPEFTLSMALYSVLEIKSPLANQQFLTIR